MCICPSLTTALQQLPKGCGPSLAAPRLSIPLFYTLKEKEEEKEKLVV
jgi:hypothetical protein